MSCSLYIPETWIYALALNTVGELCHKWNIEEWEDFAAYARGEI